MVRIGDTGLTAAVRDVPGFGPHLELALPVDTPRVGEDPASVRERLSRGEVEELRDHCEAFLRGEPVR